MTLETLLWVIWALITFYTTTSTLIFAILIIQDPLDTIKELSQDPIVLTVWILITLVNIPLWNHSITTYPF